MASLTLARLHAEQATAARHGRRPERRTSRALNVAVAVLAGVLFVAASVNVLIFEVGDHIPIP